MAGALGLVATGGHFHSAPVPNIKVTGTIPSPLSNGILTTTASFTASGGTAPYQFGTTGNLPPGMNIAGNSGIVAGIPTTLGSYTFSVIAIDANGYIGSTSFTIVVAPYLSDTYYLYTTLLINGETNSGTNYIADASTNNFALTVSGAANPNRFSPLWGAGYYGYNFSSGYLSYTQPAAFTGDFTIEGWVNPSSLGTYNMIWASSSPNHYFCLLQGGTSSVFGLNAYNSSVSISSSANVTSINQWHHIAFVRISGVLYFYIDGVQTGSGTFTGTIGSSGTATIGMSTNYSGTDYFNGFLSNFRIVNGVGVYTNNFTVPTGPLTITQLAGTNITAITSGQTQLLTAQNNNFSDNSTNASTFTPTGTVKVVSNQPFGALPSSVQNYGSSLFDGSTGYLSSGARSAFAFGTGDFTIEFWMYVNSSAGNYETMYSLAHSAGSVIVRFGNSSSYNSLLQVSMTGSTASVVYSTSISQTTALNNWVHVAFTRASSTCRVFYNGIQQVLNTGINPTTFPLSSFTDTTNVNTVTSSYIGGDGGITYFPGYISNARVVNGTAVYTSNFIPPTTPLTAIANTSLLTLQNKNGANNNTFYDDSVNNFPITRTGTPTQGTFTPFSQTGWSNYFDGSTGYLTAPSNTAFNFGSGAFTIEFWAYLTAFPTVGNAVNIFQMGNHTGGGNFLEVGFLNSSGTTTFVYNLYNTAYKVQISTNFSTLNTWTHFAVIFTGTTVYTSINGVLSAGTSYSGSDAPTGQTVLIGYELASPVTYFSGFISNLRVLKGTALYTTNFTPPTTPLTAIANTALLTCQSNRFIDNSTNAFTLTASGTVQVQAFLPFPPGVSYSSANNGGSMYFSATGNYLYYANNVFNISSGTLQWTFETWVYPTNTNTNFFAIGSGGAYGNSMFCGWNSNNFNFGQGNGGSNPVSVVSTSGTYYPYAWYHYAVSKDSLGNIRLFINGTQVNTQNYTSTVASGTTAVINGVYDNNGFGNSGGQWYLSGLRLVIGQTLYTSAFTPPTAPPTPTANTSLLLLGTNTGIQDATGKNDIITVGSAMTQSNTVKYGTGALYFNGAGNYLLNPAPANPLLCSFNGSFTIEMWVYLTSTGNQYPIFSGYGSSNSQGGIQMSISSGLATGSIYVSSTAYNATNSTSIAQTTWTHLALVRNGTTLTLYVNGVGGTGVSASGATNYSSSFNLYVGQNFSTSYPFTGYIDDLRITNGVARYTANFTPPTVPDLTQ